MRSFCFPSREMHRARDNVVSLRVALLTIVNFVAHAPCSTLAQSDFSQTAKIAASDPASGDFFGIAVSVSGGVVLVGANSDDCSGGGVDCGSAYVFEKNGGGGSWVQAQKLTAGDGAISDGFGAVVAISGSVIIIGAWGVGNFVGAAYVFEKSGGRGVY